MAKFALPIPSLSRRGLPFWVDALVSNGHYLNVSPFGALATSTKGIVSIGADANYFSTIPVAGDLPANDFEFLCKVTQINKGVAAGNYFGVLSISLKESKSSFRNSSYVVGITNINLGQYSLYLISSSGVYTQLGLSSAASSAINTLLSPLSIRVNIKADNIRVKVWSSSTSEPAAWGIDVKNSELQVSNVDFDFAGTGAALVLNNLAYATNGDTADFDSSNTIDSVVGSTDNVLSGDIVTICDAKTNGVLSTSLVDSSGVWVADINTNNPVYAKIEKTASTELDFIFAKYGSGYLSGDFPDSSVKDGGVPTKANVSVSIKSDNAVINGSVVHNVETTESGEWRVSNLQLGVDFDVTARKLGRKDAIMPRVQSIQDPDFTFFLMGAIKYNNYRISGLIKPVGAAPPISITTSGNMPYGLTVDSFVVNDKTISLNAPARDYGAIDFDINITDSLGGTIMHKVESSDVQRDDFVRVVYRSPITEKSGSGTSSSGLRFTIPSTVNVGDILLVGMLRRQVLPCVINDGNGQEWERIVSSPEPTGNEYLQWSDIYWRYAVEGDADKFINIQHSNYISAGITVLRGIYAGLTIKSFSAPPLRYDETYSKTVKNLAPITHDSGFIYRVVSCVYANTTDATANTILSDMDMQALPKSATKRLQIGTTHLRKGGVFQGVTFTTSASNTLDSVPDVSIIIDEVRP